MRGRKSIGIILISTTLFIEHGKLLGGFALADEFFY